MKATGCLGALFVSAMLASPGLSAQVNDHQAQQAGKVWGDKIGEHNRRDAQARNARLNRQGIRYDAPLTQADRALAQAAHREQYDRLVESVGTKNADRWLDFEARQMRSER